MAKLGPVIFMKMGKKMTFQDFAALDHDHFCHYLQAILVVIKAFPFYLRHQLKSKLG